MSPSDLRFATHSFKKLRNTDTSESSSQLQGHSEMLCTMSIFRSHGGMLVKCVSFVMSSYSVNTTLNTSSRPSINHSSACSEVKVEEDELVCVWVDKEISGCNVLMHDS